MQTQIDWELEARRIEKAFGVTVESVNTKQLIHRYSSAVRIRAGLLEVWETKWGVSFDWHGNEEYQDFDYWGYFIEENCAKVRQTSPNSAPAQFLTGLYALGYDVEGLTGHELMEAELLRAEVAKIG